MSGISADILLVYTDEQTHQVIVREEADVVKEINQLKTAIESWKQKWEHEQSELMTSKNQLYQLQMEIEALKAKTELLAGQVNNKTDLLEKELVVKSNLCNEIKAIRDQLINEKAINDHLKLTSEEEKSIVNKKLNDLKIENNNKQNIIDGLKIELNNEKQTHIKSKNEVSQIKSDLIKERKINSQLLSEMTSMVTEKLSRKPEKKSTHVQYKKN